jgi:hypothetical protein
MVGSMGRVGSAADNAAMESFLALLQENVAQPSTMGHSQRNYASPSSPGSNALTTDDADKPRSAD